MPYRVYYEDTDAGGVVYHANYLKFAERARTDWLRKQGLEQSTLREKEGLLLVVYRLEIDYTSPAKLDDLLDVETHLVEMSKVTMKFTQVIRKGEKILATLSVEVACINKEGKPARLPEMVLS